MKPLISKLITVILLFAPLYGYAWSVWFGFSKLIMPVIELYGFWTWLGYIMLVSVIAFISGFVGTWAWATAFLGYKEQNNA